MPVRPTVLNALTGVNVADADAAVANVLSPKTFYAVAAPKKTGTMPTVALAPASNAYPAGYHAGAASLTAVEPDLVAAKIQTGQTIFGVAGTLSPGTLAEDVEGDTLSVALTNTSTGAFYRSRTYLAAGAEADIVAKTLLFNATSLAFAVAFAGAMGENADADNLVLRLYMDGVLMQTSAELPIINNTDTLVVRDFKALSGNKVCKLAVYSGGGAEGSYFFFGGSDTSKWAAAIAVGSVKLV
ncbi:MAG: hypothetical protein Q8P31_13420 [Bacillota bacterium]|nr:hypothetical protein [Bacillota bacterium]